MRRKNISSLHPECAVARALAKVGDTWSVLVVRDIAMGLTRFDQIRASLDIAPNVLAQRLQTLTRTGVLAKQRYSERPPRDEYVLTAAGRGFLPILYVIAEWGRLHGDAGPVTRLRDVRTGGLIEPIVVDRVTGEVVVGCEFQLVLPGGSQAEGAE